MLITNRLAQPEGIIINARPGVIYFALSLGTLAPVILVCSACQNSKTPIMGCDRQKGYVSQTTMASHASLYPHTTDFVCNN